MNCARYVSKRQTKVKSWLKLRKAKLVEKTKMLERSWDKFVGDSVIGQASSGG